MLLQLLPSLFLLRPLAINALLIRCVTVTYQCPNRCLHPHYIKLSDNGAVDSGLVTVLEWHALKHSVKESAAFILNSMHEYSMLKFVCPTTII